MGSDKFMASPRGFAVRRKIFVFFFAVIAGCWVFKDNYPFSHFPMYDQFPDHTYYVFVSDGRDRPIPLQTVAGTRTARFKKPYDKEIRDISLRLSKRKRELTVEERKPAAERALRRLYESSPEHVQRKLQSLAPLKMYHADIFMIDGRPDEWEPELIAELNFPQ